MLQDEIQNNKLQILGKFAASLAHEIRNPLSAIKLNLEYAKMTEMPEDIRDSINSSLEAVQRIQELIENTLDFSRTTINDIYCQSLNGLVEMAMKIMTSKASVLRIRLETELTRELPNIYFNKNKMLQVVLNLITNAFEAIEGEHGRVVIKTYMENSSEEQFVTLEIEDNGQGISEENKNKIFNDFYTNKTYGTGLGLSVCRMILEEYNARISFDTVLGKGTRFFVKFSLTTNK